MTFINVVQKTVRTPVESLRKGLQILELLCGAGREGLALGEVAARMDLKPTTTHNLLKTLSMCGYAHNAGAGPYCLGEKAVDIARLVTATMPVPESVRELLQELAGQLNESVVLTTLAGGYRRVLIRISSTRAVQVNSTVMDRPGGSIWATCTGWMLTAFCTSSERDAIVAREGLPGERWDGIRTRLALTRALAGIREAELAEQHGHEVAGLAVPVRAVDGILLGALGMHMPEYRWTSEIRNSKAKALASAALRLAGVWADGIKVQKEDAL